jgi:hypothetical protein
LPGRAGCLFRSFGRGACAAGAFAGRILGRLAVIIGPRDRGRKDGNVQTLRFGVGGFARNRFALARAATTARGRRLFLRGSLLHGRRDGRLDGDWRDLLRCLFGYRLGCAWFTRVISAIPTVAIAARASFAILTLGLTLAFTLGLLELGLTIAPILTLRAFLALLPGLPFGTLVLAVLTFWTLGSAFGLRKAEIIAVFVIAVEIIAIVVERFIIATKAVLTLRLATLALLLFLTGAIVGQHAEIMVGELEIIFRVHPIPGELCVAGHVPVFLKKLGSIAPRAVVDAVAIVATAPVITTTGTSVVVPAAITTAGLPVVDQDIVLTFNENLIRCYSQTRPDKYSRYTAPQDRPARKPYPYPQMPEAPDSSAVMTCWSQEPAFSYQWPSGQIRR